jgi:hypothetical protein
MRALAVVSWLRASQPQFSFSVYMPSWTMWKLEAFWTKAGHISGVRGGSLHYKEDIPRTTKTSCRPDEGPIAPNIVQLAHAKYSYKLKYSQSTLG